jgi:hypothetical protein
MQYLSQIALGMILDIKQYWYYIQNNLSDCTIFQKQWYKNNFSGDRQLRLYILKYFSDLVKNRSY